MTNREYLRTSDVTRTSTRSDRIRNADAVHESIRSEEASHAGLQVIGSLASFMAMAGSMAVMISLTLI